MLNETHGYPEECPTEALQVWVGGGKPSQVSYFVSTVYAHMSVWQKNTET